MQQAVFATYSLNGEKITSEVTTYFLIVFSSLLLRIMALLRRILTLESKSLLTLLTEINDKRTYAIIRANSSIYKNEPSAITAYGNRKGAEKLNPQMTYNQYKELLKTAQIEIMFVGGEDNKDAINKLKQAFSSLDREFIPNTFENLSPIKSQVCEVTEEMDVNQCKMVMAFKSEYNNIYANRLMTTMLGGTAFSKLFTNVREKYSLCYYCAAGFVEGKGVLIVDSGVEYSNIPKAKEEILNQIKALATGDFTHDEMKNAVLSIAGDYKSNYDSTSDLASWYFIQSIRGDNYTPEQAIELLEKITREDIIESASALKLDTIYIMKGSESQEGEE